MENLITWTLEVDIVVDVDRLIMVDYTLRELHVVSLRSWTSLSGRAIDQAKEKKTNRVAYHVAQRYRPFICRRCFCFRELLFILFRFISSV